MAGNVQSNIHINVTSNIQDTIRNFSTQFNLINGIVDSCLNNPFSITEQKIHQINSGIVQLSSTLLGMEGLIPESQFEGAFNFIEKLKENVRQLNSQDTFIDLGPVLDNDIPDWVSNFNFLEAENNVQTLGSNIGDLKNQLLGLVATGRLSNTSLMELAKKIKVPAIAIVALVEAIKLGKEKLDEFLADLEKAGDIIGDAFTFGIDLSVDSVNKLISVIDNLIQKTYELADSGIAIQNGYFTLFNYLGDEAGTEVVNFTENLKELYGLNPDNLVGGLRGILGMVSNMGLEAEKATQVVEAFTMFGQDLSAFSGYDVNEVVGQLESAVNLGSIRITSPIIRALDLTKEDVQAFRELNSVQERANFLLEKGEKVRGTYEKWLQTAGGKVETFKTSLTNLNNAMSKLFTGLYAKIAPILTDLVNMLSWCVESIAKLFNIDLKEAEANVAGDYYEKVADGIDSVAESAEEAKRQVASFDDVIQLNDKGSNYNLGESFSFDPSMLEGWVDLPTPELTEFQKVLEEMKQCILDGDFEKAGRLLGDFFNKKLRGIDWEEIKLRLYNLGKDIAGFANGLIKEIDWALVGDSVAEGINSIFKLLGGFIMEFDFKQFGISAGTLWNSFWDGISAYGIGKAFYELIFGGFESLAGFLEAGSLSDATSKIGDIIVSFFNNFDDDKITLMAESVIDLLDDIFGSIGDLHNKLKDSGIKDKLKLFITELMEGFSENSGEWGEILGEAIKGILKLAKELLITADKAGLSDGIKDFLDELDLFGIMWEWFQLKFELWLVEFKATWKVKLGMLLGGLLLGIIELLGKVITGAGIVIWDTLGTLLLMIIGWAVGLGEQLGVTFRTWWDETVVPWWTDTVMPWLEGIGKSIEEFFSAENVQKWLDGLVEGVKNIFESVRNKFAEGLNSIIRLWNNSLGGFELDIADEVPIFGGLDFKLPVISEIKMLATGGIVNKPTLGIFGEDGAEAVIPLENNLGWIDKLATRVASKINNNKGSNTPVQIPMHELQKPFYSRSEMLQFAELVVTSLRQYGVNVALVN